MWLVALLACGPKHTTTAAAAPRITDCRGEGQGAQRGILFVCPAANAMIVQWDLRATAADALAQQTAFLSASFDDLGPVSHRLAATGVTVHRLRSRGDGAAAPDKVYESLLASREVKPGVSRVVLCGAFGDTPEPLRCEPLVEALIAEPFASLAGAFPMPPVPVGAATLPVPDGCRSVDYHDGTVAIICGIDRLEITTGYRPGAASDDERFEAFTHPAGIEGTIFEMVLEPATCTVLGAPARCVRTRRVRANPFMADRTLLGMATVVDQPTFFQCMYAGAEVPNVCRLVLGE